MKYKEKGITINQAIAIFVLSASAPLVRVVPGYVAKVSNETAWLTPFVLILFGIITIFVINKLINHMKNKNGEKINIRNIDETFTIVYGKIVGKILNIIYIIWLLLATAIQTRVFGERFVITLLVYAPIGFFIISLLIATFAILNMRIEAFGRFSQFYLPLIFGIFSIILIAISKDIHINNLLPVTIYDAKKIFLGTFEIAGICSFFTYLFFFGECIVDKQNIKKNMKYAITCVVVISMMIIVTTIGFFGYKVTSVFSQPFFMALKSIKIFGSIERIESIFIAFWVIADLIIVNFLLFAATNLCKNTFNLSNRRVTVVPIMFILYILVLVIGKSYFSLINFSANFVVPLNVFFGLGIPAVTLIIAKCRKLA